MNKHEPFPLETLPETVGEAVRDFADAQDVDPAYIALPMLSALGAAIGNGVWVEMENGKQFPPAIWTLTVGASGTGKSPGYRIAERMFRKQASKLFKCHEMEMERHKAKNKTNDPEPIPQQVLVSNATVEALGPVLQENPRGLLLARNELNGFLMSFNQYKAGTGADETHYMEWFDGDPSVIHRRGNGSTPIFIESGLLSITGTIQPAILRSAFTNQKRQSGLAARFLIANPPRRKERWRKAGKMTRSQMALDSLFESLFEIPGPQDDDRLIVRLDDEACRTWEAYFNAHHEQQFTLEDDMAAVWSKLLNYASRLALVFHVVKQVDIGGDIQQPITDETLMESLALIKWFKRQSMHAYDSICQDQVAADQEQLVDWIKRKHDGVVTPRDVQRGIKRIQRASDAEAALHELAREGRGEWDSTDPKIWRFRLFA